LQNIHQTITQDHRNGFFLLILQKSHFQIKNLRFFYAQANYDDAKKICGGRDMSLASLETIAENDVVQDWLGDIGLSSTSILTSLKASGANSFDWIGGVAADFLKWAPSQPVQATGGCASMQGIGLSSVDCNTVSNFICETKPNATTTTISTTTLTSTTTPTSTTSLFSTTLWVFWALKLGSNKLIEFSISQRSIQQTAFNCRMYLYIKNLDFG